MFEIKSFTFNPFSENTYLIYNETKETLIIDPGTYFEEEQIRLLDFITKKQLQPVRLLNTHGHLDHIFGNHLIAKHFDLYPEIHFKEEELLTKSLAIALQYDLSFPASPAPKNFLSEADTIHLGEDEFRILFTPGHSPGSICFYCPKQDIVIGGDVLFKEGMGRTDLPGGNHTTLLNSIKEKLYPLPDATVIYPGHGPTTSIGYEKSITPSFPDP